MKASVIGLREVAMVVSISFKPLKYQSGELADCRVGALLSCAIVFLLWGHEVYANEG